MKILFKIIAILTLFGTIVPAFAVFYGHMDLETCKIIMGTAAIIWLLTGPILMVERSKGDEVGLENGLKEN